MKLLTALRNADVEPTAALLNPLDYETLRTLSGTSPYLSGPPITVDADGQERLFSVPLVVSPSVPDDTAVIADMQSVGVWLRSMQIYISESHAKLLPAQPGRDPCRAAGRARGARTGRRRHRHRVGLSDAALH